MFGLHGFAMCDGEDCKVEDLLKIGLVPGSLLTFSLEAMTPSGWQVHNEVGGTKLYCPACVKKQQAEAKRSRLSVVP